MECFGENQLGQNSGLGVRGENMSKRFLRSVVKSCDAKTNNRSPPMRNVYEPPIMADLREWGDCDGQAILLSVLYLQL